MEKKDNPTIDAMLANLFCYKSDALEKQPSKGKNSNKVMTLEDSIHSYVTPGTSQDTRAQFRKPRGRKKNEE